MSRTALRSMARVPLPKKLRTSSSKAVDLAVGLQAGSEKPFYTLNDTIAGAITISAGREQVILNAVEVYLIGRTKILVNAAHGTSTTTHTFLRLEMPGPVDVKQWSKSLQPGEEHVVPFDFVIPEMLPDSVCTAEKPELHEQHLRLPPTMGSWERDDMSPNMVKIEYGIFARVALTTRSGTEPAVVDSMYPIKLLPDYQEDPPLALTKQDKLYSLEATGHLKKTRLGSSFGKLSAFASQPRPLHTQINETTTTTARVQLKFQPSAAGALPPDTVSIGSRLVGSTYFNQQHINHIPGFHRQKNPYILDAPSNIATSISFPLDVQQVNWTPRRVSKSGDKDEDPESDQHEFLHGSGAVGAVEYVATVEIPVEVPPHKPLLIPSFHTCFASRIYVLHVTLSGGKGLINSDVKLAVPVQVISE